jgi:hypothetical protein
VTYTSNKDRSGAVQHWGQVSGGQGVRQGGSMAVPMVCDRAMVTRMPMHLMMFFMNCLMRTMISNSVAHVVSRSGDGDMVTTGGEGGGTMVVGWGTA